MHRRMPAVRMGNRSQLGPCNMSSTGNETDSTDARRRRKSLLRGLRRAVCTGDIDAGRLLPRPRIHDLRVFLPGLDILRGGGSAPDDRRSRRNRSHRCRAIPGLARAPVPQHRNLSRLCVMAAVLQVGERDAQARYRRS